MAQASMLDGRPGRTGSARPAGTPRDGQRLPAGAGGAGSGGRLAPASLPALLALPELARQRVVRALPPLRRHQCLFENGDTQGQLFLVRAGYLRSSVQEAGGAEQVVGFHLPGDALGFGTEVFRGTRAIALERCSVCAIRLGPLLDIAGRVEGLQAQLYALVERAMSTSEQHVLMMGRRGARERVALFLHTWSRRLRAAGFRSTELDLPMRREDIASYIGLATETASRAISRLHHTGVVAVHNRHVTIRDGERLAAIAGIDGADVRGADATALSAVAPRR